MEVLQLFLSWAVLGACVIVMPKIPQSSFLWSNQWIFLGLPLCLMPCTPPSSAIFGYLPSFILITWLKYLKHCYHILEFTSFYRWTCFLMSSLHSLFLCVTPRILLGHAISKPVSHCSEEHFIVQVSEL